MSAAEIDAYLDQLDEPKHSTLQQLRRDILSVVPDAEQCLSYAVPGFKVDGTTIAGFAAFKNHLSYLPTQRLGVSSTGRRAGRVPEIHRCVAVRDRPTTASRAGREADRCSTPPVAPMSTVTS